MNKLNGEQLEELKNKISVIRGLYKASKMNLFLNKEIRAGDLRRYNSYLKKVKEITKDNEFINFSVSVMTAWDNDHVVDGTEFNSRINQFFEYVKQAYSLDKKKENIKKEKWIRYTSLVWLLSQLLRLIKKYKIISIILAILTLLAIDYSLAWKNIRYLINFFFKLLQNRF